MSITALSADTVRLVEQTFPPAERPGVLALLADRCGTNLPFMEHATPEALERVRFAAIKLSAGSVAELARAVAVANEDSRDVLVAAGFGRQVLAHRAWWREVTGA